MPGGAKITAGRIGERALDTERWRSEQEYALYLEHRAEYDWVSGFCAGAQVAEVAVEHSPVQWPASLVFSTKIWMRWP